MLAKKLLFVLLLPFFVFSQERFGNEWINTDQNYYKIEVVSDGVYALTFQDLQKMGIETKSFDPRNLKIYLHGKEISILVEGETDGVFDVSDRIIFYAEQNKGELDSLVYRPSSVRMNTSQSLFSDKSTYFLTYNNAPGKRIITNTNQGFGLGNYQLSKLSLNYTSQYSFNNIIGLLPNLQQSYYEPGEGRTGMFLSSDSLSTFKIDIKNFLTSSSEKSSLKIQLNGRSNTSHKIVVSINDVIQKDTLVFGSFEKLVKRFDLKDEWLSSGQLKIIFLPISQGSFDWYSPTNFDIIYPKKRESSDVYLNGRSNVNYEVPKDALVFNITDKWNVSMNEVKSNSFSSIQGQSYFVSQKLLTPILIGKADFEKYKGQKYNYVILTDESLVKGAEAYAAYRSSEAGGSFSTLIVTPEKLYNQFTYGFRNPEAVRRFSDYILNDQNETVHLFLVGRPVTFPDELKGTRYKDFVPSYGYPGSDVLLTAGTGNEDLDVPGMSTGRLNVTNNEGILNYLAKVKETESAPIGQSWKKKMLHLSGGKEPFEIATLANLLESIKPKAEENLLGAQIKSLRKQSLDEIEPIDISKEVNAGVGMITFAGHGSANVIDLNIGYCSPAESGFKNKGKYPLMFFNGCGVGNVFYRYDPLTTDWLLTPEKGAIAIFANSFWSYLFPTQLYLNSLYEKLFIDENTVNLSLGEIQQAVNRDLVINKGNQYILANMHQMILQGDPAIKMFPLEAADFAVSENGFQIKSTMAQMPISSGDSLVIYAIIENLGRFEKESMFNVNVQIEANGEIKNHIFRRNSFAQMDTLNLKVPNYKGITKIELLLNSGIGSLKELRTDNNNFDLLFDNWEAASASLIYPTIEEPDDFAPLLSVKVNDKLLENDDYISATSTIDIRLLDDKSLENSQVQLVDIKIYNQNNELVDISIKPLAFTNAKSVLSIAAVNLIPGSYKLNVTAKDRAGNDAKPYQINFRVSEGRKESSMVIYPNPIITNAQTQLTYQLISGVNPVKVELLVYNSLGQLVKNEILESTIGKNQESLDLKSFAQGAYTAKLMINWSVLTEVLTSRFVVP